MQDGSAQKREAQHKLALLQRQSCYNPLDQTYSGAMGGLAKVLGI